MPIIEKENPRVREALKQRGIFQWQLSKRLGISEVTLVRWLRDPLPEEVEEKIMSIIQGWK